MAAPPHDNLHAVAARVIESFRYVVSITRAHDMARNAPHEVTVIVGRGCAWGLVVRKRHTLDLIRTRNRWLAFQRDSSTRDKRKDGAPVEGPLHRGDPLCRFDLRHGEFLSGRACGARQ
jgi:hypothetical protein